jgi:hypothetical protein
MNVVLSEYRTLASSSFERERRELASKIASARRATSPARYARSHLIRQRSRAAVFAPVATSIRSPRSLIRQRSCAAVLSTRAAQDMPASVAYAAADTDVLPVAPQITACAATVARPSTVHVRRAA